MPSAEQFTSVIGAARTNAEWAWRRLYEWYAPTVLQFLRAQRADDPEGLLGDVFLDVVRSLHTFSGGPDDFRSWLFRIAQNRFLDERRSRSRRREDARAEHDENVPDRAPGAEQAVLARSEEERLYRLLALLPEDQRAAVFMRVVLDMQPAEISEATGRRVGAVKMLIQRGLGTLRKRAGDEFRERP